MINNPLAMALIRAETAWDCTNPIEGGQCNTTNTIETQTVLEGVTYCCSCGAPKDLLKNNNLVPKGDEMAWTGKDIAYLKEIAAQHTKAEVATLMGRSINSISYMGKRQKLVFKILPGPMRPTESEKKPGEARRRKGRPKKYTHFFMILDDKTVYTPSTITQAGFDLGFAGDRTNIRHTLARFTFYHDFPRENQETVKVYGQPSVPGWSGEYWKSHLNQAEQARGLALAGEVPEFLYKQQTGPSAINHRRNRLRYKQDTTVHATQFSSEVENGTAELIDTYLVANQPSSETDIKSSVVIGGVPASVFDTVFGALVNNGSIVAVEESTGSGGHTEPAS